MVDTSKVLSVKCSLTSYRTALMLHQKFADLYNSIMKNMINHDYCKIVSGIKCMRLYQKLFWGEKIKPEYSWCYVLEIPTEMMMLSYS
jgi:hypothetical protein